ncbi:sensor histidine kinase [bacterium]|nr:sensor histidine kinase [bacterium]
MISASEISRSGSGISRLWGNFAVRVFVCLLAAMTTLVLLHNLFFIHFRQQASDAIWIKESAVLTSLLADNVRIGVFSENRELLEVPIAAVLKQEDVLGVAVMNRDGGVLLAECRKDKDPGGECGGEMKAAWAKLAPQIDNRRQVVHFRKNERLIFAGPVMTTAGDAESLYFDVDRNLPSDQEILGFVAIVFDTKMLELGRQDALVEGIVMTGLFFFLLVVATWLIVRTATRPIRHLVEMVRASDIPVETSDEIGLLRESFTSMVEQLSESFTTINRLKNELEELTSELINSQEQERNRLAFDLHDNIAQELSALNIFCSNITEEWPDAPETFASRFEQINRSLSRCINSVRDLSYDLSPPGLRQLGFVTTIRQLCNEFAEATCIEVNPMIFGFNGFEPQYDVAINCYRIIQEALNNVKKHARASWVEIKLLRSWPDMILRIKDDGKGFDVQGRKMEAAAERRMGLKSMEKRADLVGGTMSIKSSAGKGTMIIVTLPCGGERDEQEGR